MSDKIYTLSTGEELFPLSALLYFQQNGSEEEKAYYGQFGWEQVEYDASRHPNFTALMQNKTFITRLDEYYYDRFLAGETMEQWQRHLQSIADRTACKYERALALYKQNKAKINTAFGEISQTTTYNDVTDDSTASGKTSVNDTPDQEINDSQDYAGSVSKTTSGNKNIKSGSVTTVTDPDGNILKNINVNIDDFRDLETAIMIDFGKAFLSTVWY